VRVRVLVRVTLCVCVSACVCVWVCVRGLRFFYIFERMLARLDMYSYNFPSLVANMHAQNAANGKRRENNASVGRTMQSTH
jgi:hypothetical protein